MCCKEYVVLGAKEGVHLTLTFFMLVFNISHTSCKKKHAHIAYPKIFFFKATGPCACHYNDIYIETLHIFIPLYTFLCLPRSTHRCAVHGSVVVPEAMEQCKLQTNVHVIFLIYTIYHLKNISYYMILPPFQIIRHSSQSIYTTFAMHLRYILCLNIQLK